MKPIDPEWLMEYVDTLIQAGIKFGIETAMGKACAERADHILDMVKAWKEHRAN
jgi:hypothetical protein